MLKYIGKGRFIPNVPARDLQDTELSRFNVKRLLDSGLYTEVRKQEKIIRNRKRSDLESEED